MGSRFVFDADVVLLLYPIAIPSIARFLQIPENLLGCGRMQKHDEKGLTTRAEDYSEWYQDVIAAADLAEHAEVKGAMIIKPYGYALWENMQRVLDAAIKATGHSNVYFPLLIPESYLKREKAHVEGFSPELAVVTHAGGEKLAEPLVVRPTSETIIYATYAKWIHSWRDLPLLLNQWANVVRWELRPRLFLRTTEFLWQEGHTAHTTEAEAEEETLKMLEVYRDFAETYLAIPVVPGHKSDSERFAGALRTFTVEAMMQDGKALQLGTSHNLGQNFAKVFGVKYLDQDNAERFVWQTSWGVSTRMIGGLIMAHSDDKGLVMPPKIAPIQAVILPMWKMGEDKGGVLAAAEKLLADFRATGIRAELDLRDERMGVKHFHWEKKGVPVRVEIGPRDVAAGQIVVVRRDEDGKKTLAETDAAREVKNVLDEIQSRLFKVAKDRQDSRTYRVDSYEEFKSKIEDGGFFMLHWCGDAACEAKIKEDTKATIRCIPFAEPEEAGQCVVCGQASKKRVVVARAY